MFSKSTPPGIPTKKFLLKFKKPADHRSTALANAVAMMAFVGHESDAGKAIRTDIEKHFPVEL